jgi:hypothetical protein
MCVAVDAGGARSLEKRIGEIERTRSAEVISSRDVSAAVAV